MSSEPRDAAQSFNAELDAMVREAEELYATLKKKHDRQTKVDSIYMGVFVWFVGFVGLAIGSVAISGRFLFSNPVLSLAVVSVIALIGIALTYALTPQRRFPFADLSTLVAKMREGKASSEDGLRLLDTIHQATLAVKKGKVDSAFTYGAGAFVLVTLFGKNVGFGLLTGVIVYLYFRSEAIREYENELKEYEQSKREFIQSL